MVYYVVRHMVIHVSSTCDYFQQNFDELVHNLIFGLVDRLILKTNLTSHTVAISESCKDVKCSDQLTHVLMITREIMLDLTKSSILPKVADHSNNFTVPYYAAFPYNCVHSKQNLPR